MKRWFVLIACATMTTWTSATLAADPLWFYCGTYTTRLGHVAGRAEGIGIFQLDSTDGAVRQLGESPPIANSSHLCLGPGERFLYAISEISEHDGKQDGYLTVFSVDPATKMLTEVQRISSAGPGPAYVRLDGTGRYLLLANYVAGNVVVYPIRGDGTLAPPVANEMHRGSSVNPERQEGPHPHAIVASPDNRFVFVPDLGLDRIVAYEFDAANGALSPRTDLDTSTPAGSGPRHFLFSPSGRFAFLSLELTSEVAAYAYDRGQLIARGRYSTLPADFDGQSTCAEIRISPDEKNVYVSNRGHDSIAVFAIRPKDGTLQRTQVISTQGKTPRNFGLSPDGRWVLAGNQDSHSIVSFRRDPQNGQLVPSGRRLDTPSPVIFYFFGQRQ